MKLLEGKVAIVTGAARGIGEGIALKFAEHGAHVAFTYVSDSSAEKAIALESKLTALGVKAKDNLLLRMTPEQWNDVIQVNLNSVFYMTKQVIRPMMKARAGSIINMSSIIGEIGNAGQSSYAASKAGIIGFTKSVAKELGSRNVRCNAIAPGFVETDMTSYLKDGEGADKYKAGIPLGKFASPEDIANATLFLASDMSSYITGQTLSVCGGLNM